MRRWVVRTELDRALQFADPAAHQKGRLKAGRGQNCPPHKPYQLLCEPRSTSGHSVYSIGNYLDDVLVRSLGDELDRFSLAAFALELDFTAGCFAGKRLLDGVPAK